MTVLRVTFDHIHGDMYFSDDVLSGIARRKALLCDNGELCPLSAWLLLRIIVSMVTLILVMMLYLDCPVQSISSMEGHCVSA